MEDHIEWGALPPALTSDIKADADRSQLQPVLIYFIPGNPGLIEYYRAFSEHLRRTLQVGKDETAYHFIGRSLAGFSIHHTIRSTVTHPHPPAEELPVSLEDQVSFVERQIEVLTSRERPEHTTRCTQGKTLPMPVILVGHSVGTYIVMQTIERRQSRQKADKDSQPDHEIVGGICVSPTIVDIARSPSGKKVYAIASSTYLAPALHFVARLLSAVFSISTLARIVSSVTGQNAGAAKTTAAFISSRYGVRQALHMGRHELLEMTHDKWSDDVWDGPLPRPASSDDVKIDRPDLYFYWGEKDHWIDNRTRDQVISSRARRKNEVGEERGPHMDIDTLGTPHDFCIDDESSRLVAEKVAGYVRQITERWHRRK